MGDVRIRELGPLIDFACGQRPSLTEDLKDAPLCFGMRGEIGRDIDLLAEPVQVAPTMP